jgi:hypothetical protein
VSEVVGVFFTVVSRSDPPVSSGLLQEFSKTRQKKDGIKNKFFIIIFLVLEDLIIYFKKY